MMGAEGLRDASEVAILSANYIAARLADHYPVLYSGGNPALKGGGVAHECILDLRPLKDATGAGAEDVAKRLIDYASVMTFAQFEANPALTTTSFQFKPPAGADVSKQ